MGQFTLAACYLCEIFVCVHTFYTRSEIVLCPVFLKTAEKIWMGFGACINCELNWIFFISMKDKP